MMAPKIAENPNVMIETEGELAACFYCVIALRAAKQEAKGLRNTTRVIGTPQSKSQQHQSV